MVLYSISFSYDTEPEPQQKPPGSSKTARLRLNNTSKKKKKNTDTTYAVKPSIHLPKLVLADFFKEPVSPSLVLIQNRVEGSEIISGI
jgi:hypothetical protein